MSVCGTIGTYMTVMCTLVDSITEIDIYCNRSQNKVRFNEQFKMEGEGKGVHV